MLTKKVAATITAATRLCSKCGSTVTLSAEEDQTTCTCGEVVHDAKNDDATINGGTTHETAERAARDSSTESDDSK